jgi:hypothetical protein
MNDVVAGAASAQGTAQPVVGLQTRVKVSAASGSLVLGSLLSRETPVQFHFVVNETAGAVLVYSALGETQNGVANASLSIPSGQSAIFVPVANSAGTIDWRSSVIA